MYNITSSYLLAPTCSDSVKNQAETDVDCGSTTCPQCNVGKKCQINSDCTTGICKSFICRGK